LKIELKQIAKRYRKEWVFESVSMHLVSDSQTSVVGNNGSGKSTLLQIIAGYLSPTRGEITWTKSEKPIPRDEVFRHVSMCSPAVQLWDELTLRENISLFLEFKNLPSCDGIVDFATTIQLEKHLNQPLKTFSSGMKQRVKLGLAILCDAPILLLDEPCSHLDQTAVNWYQSLLKNNVTGKILLIASNRDERETFLCTNELDINLHKHHP